MCDYHEMECRIWKEIESVYSHEKWGCEHVHVLKRLLESLKYIKELEKMEEPKK